MKRFIFCFLAFMIFLSVPVSADVYADEYKEGNIDEIFDALPDSAKQYFISNEIDLSSPDWVKKINTENVFSTVWSFLATSGKTPLAVCAGVVGLVVLSATLQSFGQGKTSGTAINFATMVSLCAVVLYPVFSLISTTTRAIEGGGKFMLSFVPIFCTVLYASGKPLTAATASGTLLLATEGINMLVGSIVTPIIASYMAVSICGGVSQGIKTETITVAVKKAVSWTLSLIMTVYLGVLSVQTTVNGAADSLALKTGKFMVGSFVPVVGAPISEALSTVQGCMSLLRTSVGMFGVVAMVIILLPCLMEIILWRISMLVCAAVADIFECGGISSLLKSVDSALSLLFCIMLIGAVTYIVGLTVVITAGG